MLCTGCGRESRLTSARDRRVARFRGTEKQTYVRGTEMMLVVTSAPKEMDVIDMISVLNKVVMPRTRELQTLDIVKNTVGAESVGSRPRQPFPERGAGRVRNHSRAGSGPSRRRRPTKQRMEQSCGHEGRNFATASEPASEGKGK